jgi:FkbM family methyltransferase
MFLFKAYYYYSHFGLNGLISALYAKITRAHNLMGVSRPDVKHKFFLRCRTSDIETYEKIFIKQEYRFQVLAEPEVIVDAGANIGLAALYFTNRYPHARIIAIEPETSNFQLLKTNVEPYKNVVSLQAALWNEEREIFVSDYGRDKWGFVTHECTGPNGGGMRKCHSIQGITMDKLLDAFHLNKIDILKMDIEGAEKEVFDDASVWINRVDSIIVELHEQFKPGCNRSFYNSTAGFASEWKQGENIFVTRNRCLSRFQTTRH